MKTVTIDASAAASWLFPQQRTRRADAFLEGGDYERLIAPDIFVWEIGNLIARRLKPDERAAALDMLSLLQIEMAPSRPSGAVLELVGFAERHGVSLFDAAYLQLCLQTDARLASRDTRLLEAAHAAGVNLLDLRD